MVSLTLFSYVNARACPSEPKLPTDIHGCISDDRLLVGLNTGSLRYYRLNRHEDAATTEGTPAKGERPRDPDHAAPQATKASVDLMREVEKFSKQRIESLAVVEKAALLLSLTNGYVHLHNLQSLEQQEVLSKSKGASFLAVLTNPEIENAQEKSTAGTRRELHAIVAVAVKRRLLIWTVTDQGIDPEPREIVLVSGIKSLTWITQSKLVAGLASIYVLVDVNTSTVTDVVGPGSIGGAPGQDGGRFGGAGVAGMSYLGMTAPPPLSTRLSPGEVLLAKDINTHFIDYDGNALGRRQIPWSLAPDSIGYLNPYLISVQTSKDILEIRNPHTLTLLQSLSLTSVHRLNFHREPRDGGHHNKSFLALSDRVIWNIRPLDFDRQLDDLVDQQQLDEAISLLGLVDESMLDDHDARIKQIKTLKAQALFDKHRFRDAIDLFTDIAAPPERVINLYPPFIAGSESASSAADTRSPTGSQYKREASSTESEHEKSIKSPTRKRSGSNGHLDDSHKSRVPLGEHFSSSYEISMSNNFSEDKALKAATEELRGFLVSARNKMKIFLNPDGSLKREGIEDISSPELGALLLKPSFDAASDQEGLLQTARLIDTTLFRAYMFVSPSFAGPLFRIDNFCDPEVVNEKLLEAGRYNDLVDFFHGKKLHQQALELLKKFGDIDQPDNAAPSLAGPQRTVAYLQSLPPELIDLILRFAKWPLRRNPDLAMEIFLADTENAETLSRDRVLDFLQNIDLSLAVKYLEHIIHELNDTTPSFHQRLVETYVQKLKSGQFANDEERHEWNEKTLDFLKTSRNYQAYKALNLMDKDSTSLNIEYMQESVDKMA